jgi:hypothetical protein
VEVLVDVGVMAAGEKSWVDVLADATPSGDPFATNSQQTSKKWNLLD